MSENLTPKVKNLLSGFFVLSTLGWLNALYSLWHRQSLMYGIPTQKSFCNISETVNCDLLALRPESAPLFGYPASALGLIFYVAGILVAWALFFDRKSENWKRQSHTLLVLSILGLIPTAFLAAVSIFKIKVLCLMCLAAYAINTALCVLAYLIYREHRQRNIGTLFGSFSQTILYVFAGTFLVQAPLPYVFQASVSSGISSTEIGQILLQHQESTKFRFRTEGASILGDPNAKVQIVEFADFQCPACAMASKSLTNVISSFGDEVSFVFKNFPLDSSCNENIKHPMHPVACTAALAGICIQRAKGSEAFFKFNKAAFESFDRLSLGVVEKLAQDFAGMDSSALKSCMEESEVREELTRQIREAKAAGVEGTPAIYVNGKSLNSGYHPLVLRRVIKEYLK